MRGFDNLVRQGKILYAGVSDAPAWWIAQANTLASCAAGPRSSRCKSSTAWRSAPSNGSCCPWPRRSAWDWPLAGGVLTGKYSGGASAGDGRYANDRMRAFLPDAARQDRIVTALRRVS